MHCLKDLIQIDKLVHFSWIVRQITLLFGKGLCKPIDIYIMGCEDFCN